MAECLMGSGGRWDLWDGWGLGLVYPAFLGRGSVEAEYLPA